MDRTIENMGILARTLPLEEAIKRLNAMNKESMATVAAAEATIAHEKSWQAAYGVMVAKLEGIISLSMVGVPASGGDTDLEAGVEAAEGSAQGSAVPQWEIPDPSELDTIENKILAVIGDGEPSVADITDALKAQGIKINWHSVYNLVDYSNQSLVKQGRVLFDKSRKPGRVRINPDWRPPESSYSDFIRQIHDLDTEGKLEPKHEPVVKLFAEGLKLHTQVIRKKNDGKRVHARRTWDLVRDKTLLGAIESIVLGPETSGYSTMIEINRPDLLAEKIVIDHPHLFSDEAVEAAHRRWNKLFPKAA